MKTVYQIEMLTVLPANHDRGRVEEWQKLRYGEGQILETNTRQEAEAIAERLTVTEQVEGELRIVEISDVEMEAA